ncbi:MAG: phospholipid-binding protein MlaC [Candidatus Methylomirabilales bacterium]
MKNHGRQHIVWLAVLFLGCAVPVSAGIAAGGPQDRVRDTLESALHILNDPALQGSEKREARRQEVRKLIGDRFNYTEMAERSLNSHWGTLTGKQRREFVDLFGELFERSYSNLVLDSLPDQNVLYAGESVNGTEAMVNTIVVDKRGDRLPVDYELKHRKGRWELYDVVIDGVSIVANYQSQFNKVIQTSSYEALVKKMRIKRAEE